MKYTVGELQIPKNVEKIFFVGIKGVGMTPLALIASGAGIEIAGSDISDVFITDSYLRRKNIHLFSDFEIEDIRTFFGKTDSTTCLVITTGAHKGFDNPQVKWANENGIQFLTQGQALALFMEGEIINKEDMRGIAIAGSHGKTTISSLLATALKASGYDPTYSVGTGEVFPLGAPGHFGQSKLFVAEADEYASEPIHDRIPKFLYQTPYYAIFNNIDFDHPDLFGDVDDVVKAFEQFAQRVKSGGVLFMNGDDMYLRKIQKNLNKDIHVITYGQDKSNDYVIEKIVTHGLSSQFTVLRKGHELGVFELHIPGVHNAKNALGVIAFLYELGLEVKNIRTAIALFEGTKRRCEVVGHTKNNAILIDDYGHHPLEIKTTIHAIQEAYPHKKMICIFQPHTFSRTKSLLKEFSRSFQGVEQLLLLPIFKSQRDTERDNLSVEEYVQAHKEIVPAHYFENFESVIEYCRYNFDSNEYVITTIGAGDVYKIAHQLAHE